ncbi:MAG: hypothetical protein K2P79_00170 [Sphingomonas sp.]|nr:hypothetical protein [Sphingomonas sp.]
MTAKKCQICSRDISKPSLVRCQATACPLNKEKTSASRSTLMGMLGLGLGLFAVIADIGWLLAPTSMRNSVAPTQMTRTNVNNWLDGLWRPRVPDAGVNQHQGNGSDWSAATRVETFSCSGRLSAARSVICSHWELATADYNLALVYRHALGKVRDPATLRAQQDRWLSRLDSLDATPESVMAHYRERLEQLQQAAPEIAAQ